MILEVVNQNLLKLNLREEELIKLRKNRSLLKDSLRNAALGDSRAKDYVKSYIRELLERRFDLSEKSINRWIPFDNPSCLSEQDKFDILLHCYREQKGYGRRAIGALIDSYRLDEKRQREEESLGYVITRQDIDEIYLDEGVFLSYEEKVQILVQRIFSMSKGNGVIDDLIYQKIDGVSGGSGGHPESSYEYVAIMYRGKTIRLEFLSFGSKKELRRVCKNIYRFDHPGQLSQSSGYLVNQLQSGARVSDMRPPFGSSWTFWIRMFDSVEKRDIEELFPQKGNQLLKDLLSFLIKGEQTCVITGQQGSGKTTCLEALVDFINPVYNIRTIELTFELMLQKVYPKRNIAAMRETKTVTTEQAIEFVKKTDADVVIFGEIAKETEGEKVIKLSQSGSKFSLSTHHGVTTEDMMNWFRNALLHCSGFHDEKIAKEQVAEAIRFDIHLIKTSNGERCISRISEIVRISELHHYKIVDILRYADGIYTLINPISDATKEEIMDKLSMQEREEFNLLMGDLL